MAQNPARESHGVPAPAPAPAPVAPAINARPGRKAYAYLPILGWIFLTFNSATAIYRSVDEPGTVAFVVGSYLNLLLLFWSLREFEKAPQLSARRDRLKLVVWLLASSLTLMFSYKVAAIMPVALKVAVWVMAALTTVGGFYVLILHGEKNNQ